MAGSLASSPPASPPAVRPLSAIFQSRRSSSRLSVVSKVDGVSRASDEDAKTLVKVGMCDQLEKHNNQGSADSDRCIQLCEFGHPSNIPTQASIWFPSVSSGPWCKCHHLQVSPSTLPKAGDHSFLIEFLAKRYLKKASGNIYTTASMPSFKVLTYPFWPMANQGQENPTLWELPDLTSRAIRISWVSVLCRMLLLFYG